MGWNGSDRDQVKGQRSEVKQRNGKVHSSTSTFNFNYKALLAGLLVVALGGAALWWFVGRAPDHSNIQTPKPSNILKIAETTPAVVPKVTTPVVPTEPKVRRYWEEASTNGFTPAMIRKWKFHHAKKPAVTNNWVLTQEHRPCEIFPTYVENEIAVMMTLEPGCGVVGIPDYGRGYEKQFLKSCETPIVINADDSDYVRRLKQDMIDVKIEIRERMRNGEKFADIMTATRKEAMRLAQIRRDIEQMVRSEVRQGAKSEADVDDIYAAANKMLEQKGIAPLKSGALSKRMLLRSVRDAKAE